MHAMRYWDPILVRYCNRYEMINNYNTTSQQMYSQFT